MSTNLFATLIAQAIKDADKMIFNEDYIKQAVGRHRRPTQGRLRNRAEQGYRGV